MITPFKLSENRENPFRNYRSIEISILQFALFLRKNGGNLPADFYLRLICEPALVHRVPVEPHTPLATALREFPKTQEHTSIWGTE